MAEQAPQIDLEAAARVVATLDPGGEALLRNLCERYPGDAHPAFLLGALLERLGRDEAALQAFDRALGLDANHVQALSARTAVLLRMGRAAEARQQLEVALERMPSVAQLWFNLGVVQEALNDWPGALEAYDRALALPAPPPGARMNRGYVLTRLGRLEEALANNREFARLQPDDADAHLNVAEVCMSMRRPEEGLVASERALALSPEHSKAAIVRGLALAQLGRLEKSRAAFAQLRARDLDALRNFVNIFDTVPARDPDRFDPELIFLSSSYDGLHDCDWSHWSRLVATLRSEVETRLADGRGMADPALAYHVLTLPLPASMRLEVARAISQRIQSRVGDAAIGPAGPPDPARSRLRVGYLSPDIREHLNAYLLHPVMRLHDRSRFEVYLYCTGPADASAIRRAVAAAADVFVDVAGLEDDGIAEVIRKHGIDVLVDVSGYTTHSRPGVMVRRPAPVQVGYLAFPGTQAMDAVPYRIVDRIASPEEQAQDWTEALVRLPDTFFIYDGLEPLERVELSRSQYELPEDAFVYCCFNNYYKIQPEIFDIWMDILRNVPRGVLWLAGRNPAAASNLRREAQSRGVEPDRLRFAPFDSRARYRARFALADLFLDTPIFNAMTTACDALAAGLPVLTAHGREFPSRVAASLLHAAGFTEGIVDSMEAYRERAIAWGNHPEGLAELRSRRLSNPLSTPLFDAAARVRQLEQAYLEMWRRHCEGLPPQSFDVVRSAAPAWRSPWH